jgi:chromate transport protein ChrA
METRVPTSEALVVAEQPADVAHGRRQTLGPLAIYFLKLGTIGFGGPGALVGFMHRDLVERRRSVSETGAGSPARCSSCRPGSSAASLAPESNATCSR